MPNYVKAKRHVLGSNGYTPIAYWTKAEMVEFDSGNNAEAEIIAAKSNTTFSNTTLTLGKDTQSEVSITASQLSSLLGLLQFTEWTGGNY